MKGIYKHYKGNFYRVIGMAYHTETNETLVLYNEVGEGKIWARPLNMFIELIELNGKKVPRFEFLYE